MSYAFLSRSVRQTRACYAKVVYRDGGIPATCQPEDETGRLIYHLNSDVKVYNPLYHRL